MLRSISLPEVGDGDDDQQVESHGKQSDGGQQRVEEEGLRVRTHRPSAGRVEELGVAKLGSLQILHQVLKRTMSRG